MIVFLLGLTVMVFAATNYLPVERASGSKTTSINPQIKSDGIEAEVVVPNIKEEEPPVIVTPPPFVPEFEDDEPFVDMEIKRDFSTRYDYTNYVLNSVNGNMDNVDEVYTSTSDAALYINTNENTPFPYGTISASVNSNGGDCGLVFGLSSRYEEFWEGDGVSYYFIFISSGGDLYLGRTVNRVWSELITADISGYSSLLTYEIKVVYLIDKIIVYLNDVYQFNYRVSNPLEGTGWGIRTGISGATISNITISSDVKLD